jgi:hypothetical protein
MTGGAWLSERERERASLGRAAGPRAWSWAERERAGARERAVRLGWTRRREGIAQFNFVFVFQNFE